MRRYLPAEVAAATPPGVMIVAVLRAAGRPLPCVVVRDAVHAALPDASAREWAGDIAHALASGIVAADGETWTLGSSAQVAALASTMPDDGPHMIAARAVIAAAQP